MTKIRKSLTRRALAGLSAAALGVTGVAALGTAAFAAPLGVGPDQPNAPTKGTLTLFKYDGTPTVEHDGTNLGEDAPDLPTLDGVGFTIKLLGTGEEPCSKVNLATPEGWEIVEALNQEEEPSEQDPALCEAETFTGTTSDGGEVKFDGDDHEGIPVGLYYVEETGPGDHNIANPVKPFYVTIPMPTMVEGDGDEVDYDWNYNVFAYPKNQTLDPPTKTINTDEEQGSNLALGSTVTWTIKQKVPALQNSSDTYTEAVIYDYLPDGLAYDSTVSVKINREATADYTLSDTTVSWSLKDDALLNLKAGDIIEVVFKTKVTEVTQSGGIYNPGSDDPENPGYGFKYNGKTTPGDPNPSTHWGQLNITKVDESDPARTLEGAEFSVYERPKDASGNYIACSDQGTSVATGVSKTGGVVKWTYGEVTEGSPLPLFVGNAQSSTQTNLSKDYCVYETKAPAGYAAAPVGNPITITPGTTSVKELDVENTQKEGPDLPLTGANGTILMIFGGVGLVALAGGVHLVNRRRQAEEA